MAAINRGQSPMYALEENLEETREKALHRKRQLEAKQKYRSPFLIGSIDNVNKKISRLDRKLQNYTELVIESRASDKNDGFQVYIRPPTAKGKDAHSQKEKETKQLNQFAGIFAIQSAVGVKLSDRVKNISNISTQPAAAAQNAKKDKGTPKFAELHQFPGYDPTELTPLPHGTSAKAILAKVAGAWPKLAKMSQYRPVFERLFYSQMSQAVLQDIFWWLFLEKYQSSRHNQVKLFNRTAFNYVKLLTYANHPNYREVFLRDYPCLLAQTVYAAFCESFPDSYRQFGEQFKEDLVNLVYEWVAGIRPAPRTWMQWNMDALEPPNIKIREEIMNNSNKQQKKTASLLNFDFLDDLYPSSHLTGSQSTLNQMGSTSSLASHNRRRSTQPKGRQQTVPNKSVAVTVTDQSAIDKVAQAQGPQTERVKDKRQSSQPADTLRPVDRRDTHDGLTPIDEFDEELSSINPGRESAAIRRSLPGYMTNRKSPRESHPACKGPTFVRSVFNINGQSPLVAHFLSMQNLQPEAGINFRVQRTELEDLPPLDSKTYKDVIHDSYRTVRDIGKKFQTMADKGAKEHARFLKTQRKATKEFQSREALLLSNSQEVKRLSDLIILEQRKDQESMKAGADAAIEAAIERLSKEKGEGPSANITAQAAQR